MTPESPGQRTVREWLEQHQPTATPGPEDFLFADERADLVARIDALVKRERATMLRKMAAEYDQYGHEVAAYVSDWLRARAAEEEG